MGLSFFKKRESQQCGLNAARQERGNALLYILICIVLLGTLTVAVTRTSSQSVDAANNTAADEQISRMMTYAGALASAINQMVLTGAKADTLYSTLDVTTPSGGTFNTAPYAYKIYHPMGGGINYTTNTGVTTDSTTVATAFKINASSIVTDIGPTNATTGDILFTAIVNTLANCQRINYLLWGSGTVPALVTANFDSLFTNGATVTINAGNCASCVGKAQMCVSNTANTAWGYYAVLFPG